MSILLNDLSEMFGTRKSYSIAVVCDCDDCADRDAAVTIVERCISLCHLPDVIDDFLAEL